MVSYLASSPTKNCAGVPHPHGHRHGLADDGGFAECGAADVADAEIFEPYLSAYISAAHDHHSS